MGILTTTSRLSLAAYSGVIQLAHLLNLEQIEVTNIDEFGDEIGGYSYWVSYQCKKIGLTYDVLLDFPNKTAFISRLHWNNFNDAVFIALLCGIINNAGHELSHIEMVASGNYKSFSGNKLYYLCALYGFTPKPKSLSEIVLGANNNKFEFLDLDHLFHSEIGLEYWLKNGDTFSARFEISKYSQNMRFLKQELRLKQLSNWLEN